MMWDHGWMWGWGFFPMVLGGVLPLLVVGAGVFLLAQLLGGGGRATEPRMLQGLVPPPSLAPPQPRGESALAIAERRYAAGEISRDEFVQIRDDLGGNTSPPPQG